MNDGVLFSATSNNVIDVEQKEEEQKSQQPNALLQWELMEDLDNNNNNKASGNNWMHKIEISNLFGWILQPTLIQQ